ncbi:hypothetical protein [Streptomyces sp. NPDC057418]|uniref:hypothetical protein n=1 Tax=unclassified Streptomyces TaxID=2593676 RepID=UPI0036C6A0A8
MQSHNGASTWTAIFPEQSPITVSAIADHWQTRLDVAAENEGLNPRPWEEEPWWHAFGSLGSERRWCGAGHRPTSWS